MRGGAAVRILVLGGVLIPAATGAATGQDQPPAAACGDLAMAFRQEVLDAPPVTALPRSPLLDQPIERRPGEVGGITRPSAIGEGLEGPPQTGEPRGGSRQDLAGTAPATPADALSDGQRRRAAAAIRAAEEAAAQGDTVGCRRHLQAARTTVRAGAAGDGSTAGDEAVAEEPAARATATRPPDAVGTGVREGIPNRPGSGPPLDDALESPMEQALEPPPIAPSPGPGGAGDTLGTGSLGTGSLGSGTPGAASPGGGSLGGGGGLP